MTTITRARALDEPLFESITRIWISAGISNPARMDDLASVRYNLDNGGIMLLAWEDEELAGTAWLSLSDRNPENSFASRISSSSRMSAKGSE